MFYLSFNLIQLKCLPAWQLKAVYKMYCKIWKLGIFLLLSFQIQQFLLIFCPISKVTLKLLLFQAQWTSVDLFFVIKNRYFRLSLPNKWTWFIFIIKHLISSLYDWHWNVYLIWVNWDVILLIPLCFQKNNLKLLRI